MTMAWKTVKEAPLDEKEKSAIPVGTPSHNPIGVSCLAGDGQPGPRARRGD
jgi:hypothetical protein